MLFLSLGLQQQNIFAARWGWLYGLYNVIRLDERPNSHDFPLNNSSQYFSWFLCFIGLKIMQSILPDAFTGRLCSIGATLMSYVWFWMFSLWYYFRLDLMWQSGDWGCILLLCCSAVLMLIHVFLLFRITGVRNYVSFLIELRPVSRGVGV